MSKRPELERLLAKSTAKVRAMSEDERNEMISAQAASWIRSVVEWPKAKFKWVNGCKVYESYEDYCND
jgi:hypothetical protein